MKSCSSDWFRFGLEKANGKFLSVSLHLQFRSLHILIACQKPGNSRINSMQVNEYLKGSLLFLLWSLWDGYFSRNSISLNFKDPVKPQEKTVFETLGVIITLFNCRQSSNPLKVLLKENRVIVVSSAFRISLISKVFFPLKLSS